MRDPEQEPFRSDVDDSAIPDDDPEIVAAQAEYQRKLAAAESVEEVDFTRR